MALYQLDLSKVNTFEGSARRSPGSHAFTVINGVPPVDVQIQLDPPNGPTYDLAQVLQANNLPNFDSFGISNTQTQAGYLLELVVGPEVVVSTDLIPPTTVSISGPVTATISGTVDVNITNASIAITGSVSITGVPAITINAGSATIGSINQIVSPITSRSKIAAGYQESALYLNNANGNNFLSGSNSDSDSNKLLATLQAATANDLNGAGGITPLTDHTIAQKWTPTHTGYLYQVAFYQNVTTASTVRIAVYDNSGNLIKDYGSFSFAGGSYNITITVADDTTTLSSGTAYWLVISDSLPNAQYDSHAGGIVTGHAAGDYTASGFPSTNSFLTTNNNYNGINAGTGFTIVTLSLPSSSNIDLKFDISQASAVTFSGQQVLKFGVFVDHNVTVKVTSITLTTRGLTAGTIRSNSPADTQTSGTANVDLFISDAGDVNSGSPISLNTGDTFEVELQFTLAAGSVTAVKVYLDNLNGVSYVILPLV
jgi:hypothetical protein